MGAVFIVGYCVEERKLSGDLWSSPPELFGEIFGRYADADSAAEKIFDARGKLLDVRVRRILEETVSVRDRVG